MSYTISDIKNGNRIQRELASNPSTFGSDTGVAQISPNQQLEQGVRKAGPVGAFALQMMRDPKFAQARGMWIENFGQSNEGARFNQAKMAQAQQEANAKAGVVS